ncbi:MAG TPA: ABC transporter permease [Anaerolineaceae bacterium]|nr:ABC transporter permease [Anaerolineaceae bacterium]HQN05773.1 ABC transporter permease [Anaerolineaceae bacterium]HQP08260.1 ABC transporter permease [Anaerolineaceae bacterium]
MNKLWLIMKNEFVYTVTRRSFLFTLFVLPLIAFGVGWFSTMGTRQDSAPVQALVGPTSYSKPEGLVDLSGLVTAIPEDFQNQFFLYESTDEAVAAYKEGVISSYYVVQPEYLQTGKVLYYREDFNPLGGLENTGPLTDLLAYNLVPDDPRLVMRVANPMNVNIEYTTEQTERDPNSGATFFVPYIVTFLFYIVIFGSASLMLNSITNEKTNRVIEILATSVKPIDLMTGKIIALGGVGLLQTLIWSGAGLLVLQLTGRSMPDVAAYQLPATFLLWGLVFFILGYLVFSGLMAAVGALVPSLREASQMTTFLIIPLIIPLMFISELATNPSGQLAVILSLFPLTSPVAMMARLAATAVPFWQIGLAVLLLVATVIFVLRGAAGIFRTQNLLTGKPVNLGVFLRALAGRE